MPHGRDRADSGGWVGVGLLVAFVAWTAISLVPSVAPDRTWTDSTAPPLTPSCSAAADRPP